MKKLRLGSILLISSFVFYMAYNSLFGFNKHPESIIEKTCDYIHLAWFFIGVILYFAPLHDLYKLAVKRQDDNKKNINRIDRKNNIS